MERESLKPLDAIARVAAVYLIVRTAYKLGKLVARAEVANEVHKICKKYNIYVEEKES